MLITIDKRGVTPKGHVAVTAVDGEKYYFNNKKFPSFSGSAGEQWEVEFEDVSGYKWVNSARNTAMGKKSALGETQTIPTTNGKGYTQQDIDAFRRKDEWSAKQTAWNCAVKILDSVVQLRLAEGVGANSHETVGPTCEYWAKFIYESITAEEWKNFRKESIRDEM